MKDVQSAPPAAVIGVIAATVSKNYQWLLVLDETLSGLKTPMPLCTAQCVCNADSVKQLSDHLSGRNHLIHIVPVT